MSAATRSPRPLPAIGAGTVGRVTARRAAARPHWSQQRDARGDKPRRRSAVPARRRPSSRGVDTSAPRGAVSGAVGRAAATSAAAAAAPGDRRARPAPGAPTPAAPHGSAAAARMDRLDLDATQITGNRELPRVLYVVPWRAPAAGDIEGRPVNSLLDELTKPVDRDVFRRQNRYFDALQATAQRRRRDAAATHAPRHGWS